MRLGVFSDVHGNLSALEAVLRDAAGRGVEGVLHLGDLVGYGPRPREVVERVSGERLTGVVGNYDLAVCHPDPEEGQRRYLKPSLSEVGRQTYLWTREQVGDEARSYLRTLPAQIRAEEGNTVFLFTHGSPERPNEYLLPETPEDRLRELFRASEADVLVVGHTHLPMAREVDRGEGRGPGLLLNPGSVGRPKDGDPRAAYLLLDTERGLSAAHVRVEFDVETVAAESVDFGLPPEQAMGLRLGREV